MLTSNESPAIAENSGILFIVPAGGGVPTSVLKETVLHQVTEVYPCTLTFQVSVQDPVYRPIDVKARIFLRPGVPQGAVASRIRANLRAMFEITKADGTPNPAIDFGYNIRDAEGRPAGEVARSDVFNTIRDTEGVRKLAEDLTINGQRSDVRLLAAEFPVLGSVTVINADTSAVL